MPFASRVKGCRRRAPDLPNLLVPALSRWYSFIPFIVVALVVWRRHGARPALALLVGGWAIAFSAEWSSTVGYGIPFGVYHYRPAGLTHDWLVAGVPLFDSLSFTWLAYCSYTLIGWIGGRGLMRLVLAALVMVGLDLVVDPVALLGAHWFLGSIYSYPPGSGAWFGVTLLNYVGWFVVGLALQLWLRLCLGETRPSQSVGLWISCLLILGVYLQSALLALLLGVGPSAVAALAVLLAAAALARWRGVARPPSQGRPLVVACALSSEAKAVRAALPRRWERNHSSGLVRWTTTSAPVEVWETGMGQAAARAAAAQAPLGSSILVAGVAGACAPGWELGSVGVAGSVLTPGGVWVEADPGRTAELVASGAGRECRLASVEEIADGPDARGALAAEGADLVEMETAAWLGHGMDVVALRVVLDTPGTPLGPAGALLRMGGRGPAADLLLKLLASNPSVAPALVEVGRRQTLALRALTQSVSRAIVVMTASAPSSAFESDGYAARR